MVGGRLGESLDMRVEVIKKACYVALKAHRSPSASGKQYLYEKIKGSSEAVFGFGGSWSVDDWFTKEAFGETKIDLGLFPSLKSIGNNETAVVNESFLFRFEAILKTSSLANEVEKAVNEAKQIVFAGHSSGGPLAILATLWFLEKYIRSDGHHIPPRCVTFGSPLVGDRFFPHALRRENWDRYFIHFVMRYDIVPRIMLAPLSSIERELQAILHFFNPMSSFFQHESISKSREVLYFFTNVMRNASAVASHAACNLMGCTNLLLETVSSFVKLSPYRPFGTYIFCTRNGRLVVVKNPDAVLQMLFYCSQLSSEAEGAEVAYKSLNEHMVYENELQESLEMQNVVYINHQEELPLSLDGSTSGEVAMINTALNDLGLSTRARLCLRAAGELEKRKTINQTKIDSNMNNIVQGLSMIEEYKLGCEICKVGYYDTFKLQKDPKDFNANVKRLELAGIWDEIIEMLKRYELPDEFEGRKEWIEVGTKYRRLVEPLDIANYYRHLKNEDTGPYLITGRPKRYRFTQRWREHAERMPVGSSSESGFWAEAEELSSNKRPFEDAKEKILSIEREALRRVQNGELGRDVFFDGSTFAKWWKTLPYQHRLESCLTEHMSN